MYRDWKNVQPRKTFNDWLETALAWVAGVAVVVLVATDIMEKL